MMTDKQIIIDGVDVSGCDRLNTFPMRFGEPYEICLTSMEQWGGLEKYCKDRPNCCYKKLKRKEKSEEKLVKQIQTICDFINNRLETFKGINGSVDKIITDYAEAKEQECEELKQFLSKEPLAIQALQSGYADYKKRSEVFFEMIKQYKQALREIEEIAKNCYDPADKENDAFWTILQKISEVLDE